MFVGVAKWQGCGPEKPYWEVRFFPPTPNNFLESIQPALVAGFLFNLTNVT